MTSKTTELYTWAVVGVVWFALCVWALTKI